VYKRQAKENEQKIAARMSILLIIINMFYPDMFWFAGTKVNKLFETNVKADSG
jgi:hypothetical protein